MGIAVGIHIQSECTRVGKTQVSRTSTIPNTGRDNVFCEVGGNSEVSFGRTTVMKHVCSASTSSLFRRQTKLDGPLFSTRRAQSMSNL